MTQPATEKNAFNQWGCTAVPLCLMCLSIISAAGCENELIVAESNLSAEEVELIVETQIAQVAEFGRIANLENAPDITPCAVSDQFHTLPAGSFGLDYLLFFGDNGNYRVDLLDNTLSYSNEAGEWGWTERLAFNAAQVYAEQGDGQKELPLQSGIVFGFVVDEEPMLVRHRLNGELAFEMNLAHTLSLSSEYSSRIALMVEEPNGNVDVIVSTEIPCETYQNLCEYQWDPLGEIQIVSITPEGEIAWQHSYPDRPFIATQLTVRRDGGYLLTGSTEMFSTNSVIWFMDHEGALQKVYLFLDVKLPGDEPYDPRIGNQYLHLSAAAMESEDGTLYVAGSSSGDLFAIDGTGEMRTFWNEPGVENPFFIFQLNERLGINWSIFESASDDIPRADERWRYVSSGWENIRLVNNDTIAVLGRVFGKTILNNEDGDGVAVGMDVNATTGFWMEYNSQGELLWVQQFRVDSQALTGTDELFNVPPDISGDDPPNTENYLFTNLRITPDNMLRAFAYDPRHNELYQDNSDGKMAGFPYPSLAVDVTFCPPDEWMERRNAADCDCAAAH